jgi:hypothetical protein
LVVERSVCRATARAGRQVPHPQAPAAAIHVVAVSLSALRLAIVPRLLLLPAWLPCRCGELAEREGAGRRDASRTRPAGAAAAAAAVLIRTVVV